MSANPETLQALLASGLPINVQAFMAAISEGEVASWGSFRTMYGDTASNPQSWTGSLDQFPQWSGKQTNDGVTHAAGAWQDEPATYYSWGRLLNPAVESFDPQSQIAVNWAGAQNVYMRHTAYDLSLMLNNITDISDPRWVPLQASLYGTWPGGANTNLAKRFYNNLAALQAIQSPPPPPPLAPPLPDPDAINLSGTYQGRPITFSGTLKVGIFLLASILTFGCMGACNSTGQDPRVIQIAEEQPSFWQAHPPSFKLVGDCVICAGSHAEKIGN